MGAPTDCTQNEDPLKLVREGTSQDERAASALAPTSAPANERGVAHSVVFARGYAALLKYFDEKNVETGDWARFFGSDVTVVLAVPAIENVERYASSLRADFDFLDDSNNQADPPGLKQRLGHLFASIASLASRLDEFQQALPADIALAPALGNSIRTLLAPAFSRLIGYFKAGNALGLITDKAPSLPILGREALSFDAVMNGGLSKNWSEGNDWSTYVGATAPDESVYGAPASAFVRINHCATHALFKSVFDQFLKALAKVVADANSAFEGTLTGRDSHAPHYALFLAFVRLMEHARSAGNTLTQRHLEFYFRQVLGLKEKGAQPGQVHLLAELGKQTASREFKAGESFKAGKDAVGKDAFFANVADSVTNQARVTAKLTLYRHGDEAVGGSKLNQGRLYASPIADSDDGQGAPLTARDASWHPFHNRLYADGALAQIRMPPAEVGFAIASHHLLMSDGLRHIVVTFTVGGLRAAGAVDCTQDVRCQLTTEKGWLEKQPTVFERVRKDLFLLHIQLDGEDAPIVPYSSKIHGQTFATALPMLRVTLRQDDSRSYAYAAFQHVVLTGVDLSVYVSGLKSLSVSNDFGPLDTSKPFQPYGPSPVKGSSLVIGAKEVFQKHLVSLGISMDWQIVPTVFPSTDALPSLGIDFLHNGVWMPSGNKAAQLPEELFSLPLGLDLAVRDAPDFSPAENYSNQSRHGFIRLQLSNGFGQVAYQKALIAYLRKETTVDPTDKAPAGPTASSLTLSYIASTALPLNSADKTAFSERAGQFFHLAAFGCAEQHPSLNAKGEVYWFPQFQFERDAAVHASQAEFYIGITALAPPQNLSLLFQVVDGTANPLTSKPTPHIAWSYLRHNQWIAFDRAAVQDTSAELLQSGIVTLSVPRDATHDNTLLPSGQYWIRAAVSEKSDAVCRLQVVAAQALKAVFADRGNASDFSARPLPAGTISKLERPDATVKSLTQPFPSFGGRGAEQAPAFYTRVSERLRHKNRSVELWSYERLILEAFPQIFKVKCLNHTQFEPGEDGGIYRELAPGHITLVTVPDLRYVKAMDPLKPYTSLGVQEEIKKFIQARASCFATLHVTNPQFEEVRVRFAVRLRDGSDETFCSNQLKQAITRFLSPWAFSAQRSPSFGGTIAKSALIAFVEAQTYVDYVTDFQVFRDIDGRQDGIDRDQVQGSRAVSMLVSAPAATHEILVLKPRQDAGLGETCACDP